MFVQTQSLSGLMIYSSVLVLATRHPAPCLLETRVYSGQMSRPRPRPRHPGDTITADTMSCFIITINHTRTRPLTAGIVVLYLVMNGISSANS